MRQYTKHSKEEQLKRLQTQKEALEKSISIKIAKIAKIAEKAKKLEARIASQQTSEVGA